MASTSKIALVTGAGTGVGRAAALALMNAGFTVVLAGRRKDKLDEVAGEGAKAGGKSLPVTADIADPDAVERCSQNREGVRPPRPAVQQRRHRRPGRADRRSAVRAMAGGRSTPTSPDRSCARRKPSAS